MRWISTLFHQRTIYLTTQVLERFPFIILKMHLHHVWLLMTPYDVIQFPETIHPPSKHCLKHINQLCYSSKLETLVFKWYLYAISYCFSLLRLVSFKEPRLSDKWSWLVFQGHQTLFKLFADCRFWLTINAYFRTFIWTVLF